MKERDGIGDFDDGVGIAGDAAEEDAVDGGRGVFERVENELDVGVLADLVSKLAAHDSVVVERRREVQYNSS